MINVAIFFITGPNLALNGNPADLRIRSFRIHVSRRQRGSQRRRARKQETQDGRNHRLGRHRDRRVVFLFLERTGTLLAIGFLFLCRSRCSVDSLVHIFVARIHTARLATPPPAHF